MLLKKRCFPLAFFIILVFLSALLYPQDWKGKGRFRGVVRGESGEPISKARITLIHVKLQAKVQLETDEKGEFLAAWIKGGEWNVDVEAEGYLPKKTSYQVREFAKNPPLEVILKKAEKTMVSEDLLGTAKTLLNEGNELFEKKRYKEALGKYEEIKEKIPEFYQINLNIGNCYYELEDYDSAIPHYQAVLEQEPENSDALTSLGNIYLERGELEKGMELLDKLLAKDVTSPVTLYNIGTNLFNRGKAEAAAQYYEKATAGEPSMADAYYQLGLCYLNLNTKEKAKKNFMKYLELEPDSDKAEQVKTFLKHLEK
jgi:tetratricopeptide (TPR) repeat protein